MMYMFIIKDNIPLLLYIFDCLSGRNLSKKDVGIYNHMYDSNQCQFVCVNL